MFWLRDISKRLGSASLRPPAKRNYFVMALVWQQAELPPGCTLTVLSHSPGISDPLAYQSLPIEQDSGKILHAIRERSVVAIKAETGSGKTMKGPEYLRNEVQGWLVLIVQKSCFAAELVVESLKNVFGWSVDRLHLKTGVHDAEAQLNKRWTQLSVITYGISWEWFSS